MQTKGIKLIDFITDRHHRHTQTFDWLQEAIGQPLRILYGDDETLRNYLPVLRTNPPRLLILFQLEHLAAWASCFCPVLVFPMYDLTRMTPDRYLAGLRDVEWITFSLILHQRLAGLGLSSRHYRYAPNPENFPVVSWEDGPKAYFWERLPEELDERAMTSLLHAAGISRLTTRTLADARFYSPQQQEQEAAVRSWQKRASYLQVLAEHNVFVAPRRFEGIGMAFLEAMAMGMLVVAENAPTANEYIVSGENGILFGGNNDFLWLPRPVSAEQMNRMGSSARKTMGQIHEEWTRARGGVGKTVSDLLQKRWPRTAPTPGLLEATLDFHKFPEALWAIASINNPGPSVWRSKKCEQVAASRRGLWKKLRWLFRHPRACVLDLLQKRGI